MVDKKDVTILIAVLNKVETIRNCVESLLKIKYPVSKIMIVDGYSKDGTYEILTEYKDCIDLRQFPENLSRTFNWALNQIDTEYVALTDADCIVDQNWLNELMSGFEEKDVIAVAGFCGTVKSSFLLQTLIGLEMDSRFKRLPKYLHRAPTMNLCLKTNLAKKVRFDENQGVGVETDFGFRLTKYGKMIYVPQAKVWHNHRSSFKAYFRQQKNQAKWGVRLLLKHRTKAISDPITTLDMTAQIPIFWEQYYFLS